MRSVLMNNGENIEVESFEIEGDSLSYDVWYCGKNGYTYHNLEVEYDLDEVKELSKLVDEFINKLPDNKRTYFLIRRDL